MKTINAIRRAERHRKLMQSAIDEINLKIETLWDTHDWHLNYQPSDGWVIVWDANNSALSFKQIEFFMLMNKEEAIKFLDEFSI